MSEKEVEFCGGNRHHHSNPLVMMDPYVRRDDVEEFTERECTRGGLNRIRGRDLMPILMNLIGKTGKFGA